MRATLAELDDKEAAVLALGSELSEAQVRVTCCLNRLHSSRHSSSSLCFLWQELRESLEAAATLLSSNLDAALASLEKSGSATAAAEREQLRIEAASVAASSEAAVCQEVRVQPFILIRSTTNLNMFSLEFTDCIKMVKIWS